MLVKNSLVAVVSLPAGVFNPYSGVKTSILILDKRLAKTTDSVLFVKVENDGYNLGAQRRAVTGSGLPDAVAAYLAFRHSRESGNPDAFDPARFANAHVVEKARIGENGEWNLSGDRYQADQKALTAYEIAVIGDVVGTITPPAKLQKDSYAAVGRYPIIDQSQQEIAGWTDNELAVICPTKPLVVFGDHTCAVKLVKQPFVQGADGIKILETDSSLLPAFLFHFLKVNPLETDGYKRHFTDLKRKQIPVPPLAIQQEIVAEIEGYQKIIDGARQVAENYQPRIVVQPDWPVVELGNMAAFLSGGTPSKENKEYWTGTVPWVSAKDMKADILHDASMHISEAAVAETATKLAPAGSLLILVRGMGLANGIPICELTQPCAFNQDVKAILPNHAVESAYLRLILKQVENQLRKVLETAAHGTLKINSDDLRQVRFPLPPLETQRAIVAEIEAEQALVNANKELIRRFEAKIKATINRVWGESEAAASSRAAQPEEPVDPANPLTMLAAT